MCCSCVRSSPSVKGGVFTGGGGMVVLVATPVFGFSSDETSSRLCYSVFDFRSNVFFYGGGR